MVGALTPSEIMAASASGADFVKVFPCGSIGGPKYIQALRGPFPQIPLVPTGGVTLETAADYIRAGAVALGVGGEMIAKDALKARDRDALSKLAAIFVDLVRDARKTSAKP
jgi:2-dehydro-3-deoxyphosphogluconate aldolase/(4S)-4-hydroxy-2-oxoglutarate aldolase